MEIAVIGTGYVGLVTGVCLSDLGHHVTCIDIDEEKISTLQKGISPIYEENLAALLKKNLSRGTLMFSADYKEGLTGKRIVYIAVGTPQSEDGSADLRSIDAACASIGANLSNDVIIVTKSTVPVGTNKCMKEKIEANITMDHSIKIASNPEFIRQGSAVHDTFHGDRIVIGSDDEEVLDLLEQVNAGLNVPIVRTDLRSAEMIKYASNAFLAAKISFINEMANLCERVGANIDNVSEGMGMDKRIGSAFLNAGIGYGGSCFPKDTKAVISTGNQVDYEISIVEKAVEVNEKQREVLVDKILRQFGNVQGKKIALLGLAFKPNTDDMREAPSIIVSQRLVDEGAHILAYDPVAIENAREVLSPTITYASSVAAAIADAEIAVILTEWTEIKEFPIANYKVLMADPVIFDGRNCLSLADVEAAGIEYHSIGRPPIFVNRFQEVLV